MIFLKYSNIRLHLIQSNFNYKGFHAFMLDQQPPNISKDPNTILMSCII